ncbi:efflux RND transporter periplasmic adaptor subunit [Xanthobacter agilis]|uniref:RND family efflux transporter MFP subunit n=1 Tax=Xanthobacter agilis TaxID=47492 RepID=A0ABU0LF19_XANAG|nr:efflux RND transporter periplasmic adaptor subunit [Xanthobacter agilis]MDQ0505693.1 RND family efflux transporter MFP subunit [Xanthobacter agilis]
MAIFLPRPSAPGPSGGRSAARGLRRTWPAAALALGAALALSGCGEQAPAQTSAAPARPVQVTSAHLRPREPEKTFVGVVRARREIDLAFRVGGKVVQRKVEVGDRVVPGDLIARIDPEDLKLELESARAELAAATANLAQTSAEDGRYRSLTAKGAASNAELDRKSLAKDEAIGRLERAKRALELAENRLSYADLMSDTAGVVVSTSAEPGQVVSSGQTIVRVARLDEKEALVALPETALAAARSAAAGVTLWADPNRRIAAHLRELSPQADPASRTYAARFTLDGADETVALGMTATVVLTPKDGAAVARLPLSAVFDKGHGPHVFVVEEATHTLVAKPVELAGFTDDSALIAKGVSEGDKVVTLGVQTLEPGQSVRTVPAKGATATATASISGEVKP